MPNTDIVKYITSEYTNNPYLKQLLEDVKQHENIIDHKPIPKPTDIRISTMTITCNLNTFLNLVELFDVIEITTDYPIIETLKLGSLKSKGKCKVKKKKEGKKNYFQNQLTIIVVLKNTLNILNGDDLKANIKLFRNGKVQMTGIKSSPHYKLVIDFLYNQLRQAYDSNKTILDIDTIKISDYKIVLINSDFRTNFEINRENIYKFLYDNSYFVIYEPDIYPGVNLKYFWNDTRKDGRCRCTSKCTGKGTGSGDGQCKRITIAIFQSGSVIITGSNHEKQMNNCYEFINKIFTDNYKAIKI